MLLEMSGEITSERMKGWSQSKKQYPVVDVTGDRSKVRCCKEQYCIGTWNVRSMTLKEISPGCSLEGLMLKLKLQYFGHLMWRVESLEKTLMLGGIGGRRRRGRQDEMPGWHHRLDGRDFEWTPGVGDGQGGLACCSSWGRKESDRTEWLNWTDTSI